MTVRGQERNLDFRCDVIYIKYHSIYMMTWMRSMEVYITGMDRWKALTAKDI